MKLKSNGIFVLVVAMFLFLSGCDSGTYSAEKRFWHASKRYNLLLRKAKPSPVDYQKTIDEFREITIRYPNWPNSAQAQFNIGQLYAMQNSFPKAREEFAIILKEYPENADACAGALFAIAVVYEKEDTWTKAKETLSKIVNDYPTTNRALEVPIYEAQHYKKKGQNAQAEAAYALALERYKTIIRDNPNTYGALLAADFIVACYVDIGRWDEAIGYFKGLKEEYKDTLLSAKSLFILGAIYEDKLKEPQKALEYYRELTDKYPKSLFGKLAGREIELINKHK